jgi:hypothetical protein
MRKSPEQNCLWVYDVQDANANDLIVWYNGSEVMATNSEHFDFEAFTNMIGAQVVLVAYGEQVALDPSTNEIRVVDEDEIYSYDRLKGLCEHEI